MRQNRLDNLRKKIDQIDDQLVQLLAKRTQIIKRLKEYKKKHKISVSDKNREKQIINRLKSKAKELNVSVKLIEKIIKLVMAEAKLIQRN